MNKITKTFKYFNPKFEYEEQFPDFILPWPWVGHKHFIYDLVGNIKPKTIIELGTHKGTSLFSMSQSVKDNKLKTKIYAIDTWCGDWQTGFYNESIFKEVNFIKNKYYLKQNINLIRKTFDEAKKEFEDKSIDILHIDGIHTYSSVKHDFENWFQKVTKNGIIIFHDIAEKKENFGVSILWEELKKKYKNTIEFTHSHGLGVLFLEKPDFDIKNIPLKYYENNFLLELYSDKNKELIKENNSITNKNKKLTEENNNFKEIEKLNKEINNENQEIRELENSLHNIRSSKAFKIWRLYCKILNK